MSSSVSTRYDPTHNGSYDEYGNYEGQGQTTSVGTGGFNDATGIIAYETFNAVAIQQEAAHYEAAGWVVHVTLNYELSTDDASSHAVTLNAGYYGSAGYQSTVEADQTDHSGPGNGQDAYVYQDLGGTGETIGYSYTTNFAGVGLYSPDATATYSTDISEQVQAAAGAGRDLVLTLNEQGSGEDVLSTDSTYIEVDATKGANPPTVGGTQADQPVIAGGSDLPFSTVTLGDSANPSGAGDDVAITILDPQYNETDAYGTLAGSGLTSYGNGQYEIGPVSSLSTLQSELDALVFTASASAGGAHVIFELDLQSASGSAADDENTTVDIETVCFLAGTAIATPDGARSVERLRVGDLVLTAAGAARPVRWLGRQTISTRFVDPMRVAPIRIRAGALGENLPVRDLHLSPDHAIMVDGVFVQAGALVNGVSITREDADMPERFTYFHVELAEHALILAEGVEAETFIDNVDRLAFDNWHEHEAPGAPMHELKHPRAKAHRQVPQALRARLLARGMVLYGRHVAAMAHPASHMVARAS